MYALPFAVIKSAFAACRQCIEWVNLLCLTPFAFVAVIAFLRGSSWVRIPAIVVSSFTLYSLIICIGTTL
jgi:hypothetical protein